MSPRGSVKMAAVKNGKLGGRKAAVAALVETATFTMPPCKPSSPTLLGEGLHVDSAGAPVQLMVTVVPLRPPRGKTRRLKLPDAPAFKTRDCALGVKL